MGISGVVILFIITNTLQMFKKLLYTLSCTILVLSLSAQSQTIIDSGLRFIEQKAASWELTVDDYQNLHISDMYTDNKTGNTYIYFQQTMNGLPISNALTPIVIRKDGKIFNIGSRFIANAKSKVTTTNVKLTPSGAINAAATALGVKADKVASNARTSINEVHTFKNLEFVHNDVKVTQEYVLIDDKLVLVWDLDLDVKGSADYWNTKINVVDGTLVSKQNYTIYCQHEHGKFSKHTECNANIIATKSKSTKASTVNASLMMGATYKALTFPTESPIHGQRTEFTDGLYPDASPFGWHDTNAMDGAEYTITRGNNVHAYTDKEGTDFTSDDEPDGGMDLVFDYDYSIDNAARDNESASVTNLFTAVNQIHDIMYRLGFVENAGNFQQNTYGNGGLGGDYIIAQAFDGIDLPMPNVDNANFSTPSDGSSGRMQMFVWENSGGVLSIDEPASLSGFVQQVGTATGQFGGTIPNTNQAPITGKVVIAQDADPASPTQVCDEIANPDEVAGNIALIDRGLCNFSLKAFNAQEAGAISCIICNVPGADGPGSNGENVLNMASGDRGDEVTITPLFLAKSVCDRIRLEINNGIDVVLTLQTRDPIGPQYRDAAFDNGVIAHEHGHGISNRLIGGPGNASCLTSAEQMGEGISDFVSLLLTVEEGDTRDDVRGIGNYVDFGAPAAGGIRTYPYTTDFSVNPRTYEEVPGFINTDPNSDTFGETFIYSLGEVWTISLWEMYWNLVDKYGLDVTWTDEEAGNFIMGKLFVEGMRIANCNPTLVDMRDAIITADELLYDGVHDLEIWKAFAKRGLGFEATGGSSNDVTDGVASFKINPLSIKTLKIEKTANTLVDAGDEVEITLTANNHIEETKTGIVVTDVLPEGASYVDGSASMAVTVDGATLTFNLGDMAYQDEIVITYKILVANSLKSNTIYYNDIDASNATFYTLEEIEGSEIWIVSDIDARSNTLALYVKESDNEENDQTIQVNNVQVYGKRPVLRFWHKYDTESIIDGGFLRISTTPGDNKIFELVNDKFIRNGYNSDLDYSTFAIPSLRGYSGSSNGEWIDSYVDLSDYKGEKISIQFRFGSNEVTAADVDNPGWFVDDIEVFDLTSFSSVACIDSDTANDEICSAALDFIINSNGVVGIEDDVLYGNISIGIAPNPTSDYVSIRFSSDSNESLDLELTSITGKLISTQRIVNSSKAVRTIDVSDLQSGVYFLVVKSGNNIVTTEKIVVK